MVISQHLKLRSNISMGKCKGGDDTVTIGTEINRYVSVRSSCCTDTDDGDSQTIRFTLDLPTLSKILKHIDFDLSCVIIS